MTERRVDELSDLLSSALAERLDATVQIADLDRLSGGASRETWAVRALIDGVGRDLILQRERPGGVRTGGGMTTEGELIRAAAASGVPVPPIVATDDGRNDLGASFVVAGAMPGEALPRRILRDGEFEAARPLIVGQAAHALAGIHRIPVDAAPALERPDQIAQFRAILDELGATNPTFELGFRWLEANPPPTRVDTVVHGDFRTGNLLVDRRGLVAVLDWELAHIGNPVEDLGWFCVRAWRFGSAHRAGGFGSVEELLAAYGEASGREVSIEELRWWEALGTLKWGVMCLIQTHTHLRGAARSVELAAIGRRTVENEWDLLAVIP